jgi:hypothetical protein
MDRFSRFVLGYHGCTTEFAESVLRGEVSVADWQMSANPYDWLGNGIYFWEFGPERAREWGQGGVVGAVIQLGRCLDLTDTRYTDLLLPVYEDVRRMYRRRRKKPPANRRGRRDLDCMVINELIAVQPEEQRFQTVRGPFLEGSPSFPGSGILRESHIQLAVRDRTCILGVFRPNLSEREAILDAR